MKIHFFGFSVLTLLIFTTFTETFCIPHAYIANWAPGVVASGNILARNRSLMEKQKRMPIWVTISFDQIASPDFANQFFKFLKHYNYLAYQRSENQFIITVAYNTTQAELKSKIDQANLHFDPNFKTPEEVAIEQTQKAANEEFAKEKVVNASAYITTAYITEVINNTDQVVGIVYESPVVLKKSWEVGIEENYNTEFIKQVPYKYDRVQITLPPRTKVILHGAYLPNSLSKQIELYLLPPIDERTGKASVSHGRMYYNQSLDMFTSSLKTIFVGHVPFVHIYQNKDWVESMNWSSRTNGAITSPRCISSHDLELKNNCTLTLEVTQMSGEVYKGRNLEVLDNAIAVKIKKNKIKN